MNSPPPRSPGYEILSEPEEVREAQQQAAATRRAAGLPAEDLRVGVLADDPYLRVERDAVRSPDGSLGLYNRMSVPAGATVLPLLGDRVVLIHRFRHGTRSWHLEAPRGALSGASSPEEDARRELEEEIGASATELVPLGEMHPSTGCSNEVHHLFLARIERYGEPELHEAISAIRVLSLAQFENAVSTCQVTDGPTLAAFLRARLRGII